MSFAAVLPMALVMIAGPQVITSVFLATSVNWRRNSAAFVAGAALSITLIVSAAYLLVKGVKAHASTSNKSSTEDVIDVAILVLLAVLAANVFRKRKVSEPPKWMGKLQKATPRLAFRLGFLLLGVFPMDIITSVTVGTYVARHDESLWHAFGFIGLTLLILALPAIVALTLGKKAEAVLPKARDWMTAKSWVVNEVVIVFFIGLTASSLAGS